MGETATALETKELKEKAFHLFKLVLKATDAEAKVMVGEAKDDKELESTIVQLEDRLAKMEAEASSNEPPEDMTPTADSLMPPPEVMRKLEKEGLVRSNVPVPTASPPRTGLKNKSLLSALAKIYISSTYLSGLAPFGDCVARLLQLASRTGLRADPQTNVETPGHNAHLMQPLLDLLSAETPADIDKACALLKSEMKDGFDVEVNGSAIGYDSQRPSGSSEEIEVMTLGIASTVIVPKPLGGKSHRTVVMPQ